MNKLNAVPLSKDKVILRIAGLAIITLFFVAVRFYNPFQTELLSCQFKNLTGYDCPTCGLSRSVHSFATFHFVDSLSYNPLGFVLLIGLIFLFVKILVELITRKDIQLNSKSLSGKQIGAIVFAMVLFNWIYKLIS
ncbi:MAG: DUF2752 domain-containing protein [bacterium]